MTRKQPFNKLEQLLSSIPTWIFVSVAVGLIGYLSLWVHEDNNSKSKCNTSGFLFEYTELVCDGASVLLQSAESIAIVAAVILYFKEIPDRKAQKHYEAWQVIDNAAAASVSTSYARKQALEDLVRDGVSLKSLDVPGADLSDVNLSNADLREANLRNVDLSGANLSKADLSGAALGHEPNNPQLSSPGGSKISAAQKARAILNAREKYANEEIQSIIKQIQSARHWETALYDPKVREWLGLNDKPQL
jgi:BTB/POZ domain-containing protein KCTD9